MINFTVGLLSAVTEMFPLTLFSMGRDEVNAQCYVDDVQMQNDLGGWTFDLALHCYKPQ